MNSQVCTREILPFFPASEGKTHGHSLLIALYGLLKCQRKVHEKDNAKLGDEQKGSDLLSQGH